MKTLKPAAACPCGGFRGAGTYAECCRAFVDDGEPAPGPEQLMRSRYTAFAVGNADHLWRTWHPKTRPAEIDELDGVTWTQLIVLSSSVDEAAGEGSVDFEAHFTGGDGANGVLREHSRFTKRAGRWFYVDGDELA